MATPTNTLLTTGGSAVVGMREDLSDKITMLEKAETPFFSWTGTTTASNSVAHEWEDQRLRAAAKNAKAEGDVFAATAPKRPLRLVNTCQISTEVASVSGTSEAVDVAGNAGDLDYQLLIKGKEVKRDIEYGTLLPNQVRKSTDPRECAGIMTWAGVDLGGSAGYTAPTGDGTTAVVRGTAVAISTTRIDDVMQEMVEEGAEPSVAFMHGTTKRKFDALAASGNLAENSIVLGSGRDVGIQFINHVTIYKTSFGAITFVLDKFMSSTGNEGDILIFDGREEYRPKKAVLPGRNFVKGNPQLNHDGRSQAVIWEGTLEVPAPKAVGLLTAIQ